MSGKNTNSSCNFNRWQGLILTLILSLVIAGSSLGEVITFDDSWGTRGFTLSDQDAFGVEINFSIDMIAIEEMLIEGETMQMVYLPGVILPNDAGAPNLPGDGRFIALPQGARAEIEIIDYRTVVYEGIEIAPAPPIPLDTDDSPPIYRKDKSIYNANAYYPEQPVKISEIQKLRGVDVVILGITPFQYNPVTKELIVYRDLKVKVNFIGGSGHFGEDRLRNRYWEPIMAGNLLNYNSLPQIDFNHIYQTDEDNVEYLIIVPDDPAFIAWADTIKQWRKLQGISTGITTLSEIGGNNTTAIENYINDAYFNWEPAPVAVLLLSDYQNSGDVYGITAPSYSGCISDNVYAEIEGNDNLPDLVLARITAQNETHLSTMINKFLNYERDPPTDPGFYDHPITAGGWQTARWFIICCEVCWGFMHNELGMDPVREYAIYSGTPGNSWSSNSNTWMIVDYFGPNGLGYIPADPSYLTDWGANAGRLNRDINEGAFLLLHRDHGEVTGWGEPDYGISDLSGLNNDMLPFVFSINCLTGQYSNSSMCFAEAFHRMEHGALGVVAASAVSYSFVNDTYVWGMWDSMWPEFDPGYGTDNTGSNTLRPAFANVYGKYYLAASSWPYNPQNKAITYYLFHHHGDAFITLNTQVPELLTVSHQDALLAGANQFTVTANAGALISLTVDGEIIGIADATGAPVPIEIIPQTSGAAMLVTITLQNHYRYSQEIDVIQVTGPYVVYNSLVINDEAGNNNGNANGGEDVLLSITVENIGILEAADVDVTISTDDLYTTIIDDFENYGDILAGATVVVTDGFEIDIDDSCPDWHNIAFTLTAESGDSTWVSNFAVMVMPNVALSMTPVNPPIIIPAGGGSFNYDVEAVNDGFNTSEFTFWNDVILPDSSIYGPIMIRPGVSLDPGETISRTLTQSVPANAPPGTYTYRAFIGDYPSVIIDEVTFQFVKSAIDNSGAGYFGEWMTSGWDEEESLSAGSVPAEFHLSQNYPNPFNPETSISFTLPEAASVKLTVYNILGHQVAVLADGSMEAGYHMVSWDASQNSAGVYLYRLEAGDYSQIRKCVLLK